MKMKSGFWFIKTSSLLPVVFHQTFVTYFKQSFLICTVYIVLNGKMIIHDELESGRKGLRNILRY
jgi:hypothetical protein